MKEFLFANSMWTVETINTILVETRRRVVRDKEEGAENPNNRLTETDAINFTMDSNTDVAANMEGKKA